MISHVSSWRPVARDDVVQILCESERFPFSATSMSVAIAERFVGQACRAARPVEFALNAGVDIRVVREHLVALAVEGVVAVVNPGVVANVSGFGSDDVGPFYVHTPGSAVDVSAS